MSDQQPEGLGRLEDEQEEREPSSTTDGPAAAGEYDAKQGSPDSGAHVTGEGEAAGGIRRTDAADDETES